MASGDAGVHGWRRTPGARHRQSTVAGGREAGSAGPGSGVSRRQPRRMSRPRSPCSNCPNGTRLGYARSEKPPSTISVCPRTISASARAEERDRSRDVVRGDEAPHRVRGAGGEHLLTVREVIEGARLDDAARHGVDPDPAGRELDRQVADERLERRLRGPDQGVVLEHALRAERRDRDDRRARRASAAPSPAPAEAGPARSRSCVQSQCLSEVSSAGRNDAGGRVVDEHVERPERGHFVEDA